VCNHLRKHVAAGNTEETEDNYTRTAWAHTFYLLLSWGKQNTLSLITTSINTHTHTAMSYCLGGKKNILQYTTLYTLAGSTRASYIKSAFVHLVTGRTKRYRQSSGASSVCGHIHVLHIYIYINICACVWPRGGVVQTRHTIPSPDSKSTTLRTFQQVEH
jgi:hypothetical protein